VLVAAIIAQHVFERDVADARRKVDSLPLGEVDVVGVEPGCNLRLRESVLLSAQDRLVDVSMVWWTTVRTGWAGANWAKSAL